MTRTENPASPTFRSQTEIAIHVPDLDKAKAFYGGVLGFRLIGEQPGVLTFATGDLTLWVNREEEVLSYIPSYAVEDFAAARAHLVAAGCTILRESEEEKALYFRDPFGLVADVIERPAAARATGRGADGNDGGG